jgi:hypothetical protein
MASIDAAGAGLLQRVVRPRAEQIRIKNFGSDVSFSLPGGKAISAIFWRNFLTTANPVGGLDIGITDGGGEIVNAFAIPGGPSGTGSYGGIPQSLILKPFHHIVNPTTIYVTATTSWGNPTALTLWIVMDKLNP